jgi:hypothetical protein
MKRFVFVFVLMLALGFLFIAAGFRLFQRFHKPAPVTLQQKSQHMIQFLNKGGDEEGQCTATAIGPHAILTAEHCNDKDGDDHYDTITLDLSTRHYALLAETYDSRDHVIYLIDGPAFTNYLSPDELVNVKPVISGEQVYIYGDGRGNCSPRRIDGKINDAANSADISDVDKNQQITWYTLGIIYGDSGSAIYTNDGRVVGLITYGMSDGGAAGFALNFSEQVILKAHTFSIEQVEIIRGR